MNRKLMTLLVSGMLVAGSATTAVAHHKDGHTANYFGLCTAYTNNGGNSNGQAFKTFEDTVTQSDDYDTLEEFCEDYLAENHPSDNGNGNRP